MKSFLKYFGIFIIGGLIGFFISYYWYPKVNIEKEFIQVTDTITVTQDRIVNRTITRYQTDTIIKIDTIFIEKDGTYISLPIDHKEYIDTLTFKDSIQTFVDIKYSGYLANLDQINIQTKGYKEIITVKEPKKFGLTWTIGPYLGFGFNGTMTNPIVVGWGPTIGICASIGIGGMIL